MNSELSWMMVNSEALKCPLILECDLLDATVDAAARMDSNLSGSYLPSKELHLQLQVLVCSLDLALLQAMCRWWRAKSLA